MGQDRLHAVTGIDAQYADDRNLAARQSIYAYQRPRIVLWERVLDLAALTGSERIADIGCGNGQYIGELARRGHRGPVVAMDESHGMLRTVGHGARVRGRAERLPFADDAFDVVLAMHMLYHVPDRLGAIGEFRRVVRPGGAALVVTNYERHLRELDALTTLDPRNSLAFTMESGEPELRTAFDTVERHDIVSELHLTEVAPVLAYIRSMSAYDGNDLDEVARVVDAAIARDGAFVVQTACGCFVCT